MSPEETPLKRNHALLSVNISALTVTLWGFFSHTNQFSDTTGYPTWSLYQVPHVKGLVPYDCSYSKWPS